MTETAGGAEATATRTSPAAAPEGRRPRFESQPLIAGMNAALVGFTCGFAVVLAALQGVGATPRQAASGLMALTITMGVFSVVLSLWSRMPIGVAFSTPGAALIVAGGAVDGGWEAAIGAFAVSGALFALAGLWQPLGRLVRAIPAPLASAMLAGVLLELCLAPVRALSEVPRLAIPIVLAWVLVGRLAARWAVPAAVAVAAVVVAIGERPALPPLRSLWPDPIFTVPSLSVAAVLGLALPLFVVTMASQNIPGLAVLALNGFHPPHRPLFLVTGLGTVATAPLGGHNLNLAAISAALIAGDDAHPDRSRRWIAGVASGVVYILFGIFAGALTLLVAQVPSVLVLAVAGLGLIGAFTASVAGALADVNLREAAIVTFLVAASGVSFLGVSAAAWALLAGGAFVFLQRLAAKNSTSVR